MSTILPYFLREVDKGRGEGHKTLDGVEGREQRGTHRLPTFHDGPTPTPLLRGFVKHWKGVGEGHFEEVSRRVERSKEKRILHVLYIYRPTLSPGNPREGLKGHRGSPP